MIILTKNTDFSFVFSLWKMQNKNKRTDINTLKIIFLYCNKISIFCEENNNLITYK